MRSKRYDLVISDWNMNSMSDYDFLCEVRADPSLKQTRFIMKTADLKIDNVAAAKEAGVDTYPIKPFDAQKLKIQNPGCVHHDGSLLIPAAFAADAEADSVW